MALKDSLKKTLSTTIVLYYKTHAFHFNVEGHHFYQLHKLFEEIYADTYEAIDPTAENLRKLDEYAVPSLSRAIELSDVKEQNKIPKSEAMVKELLADQETMVKTLNECFDDAITEDKQDIANFLASRIEMHQKWAWFLRSLLVKNEGFE